ncbi:MAG: hypothetical protein KKG00_11320 [Bacteroidetes bacterium]|nr:hypothetical protein [Bacteroidota bacterium]
MEKIEKYESFQEMKESAKSIDPSYAAVVMERHEKFKQILVSIRQDLINHKSFPENNKPIHRN